MALANSSNHLDTYNDECSLSLPGLAARAFAEGLRQKSLLGYDSYQRAGVGVSRCRVGRVQPRAILAGRLYT